MKRVFLFLTLSIIILCVQAQDFTTLNQRFFDLFQAGKLREALPVALQALQAAKNERGDQHIDLAISFDNVGETYFQLQSFDSCKPYFREAIRVYKKIQGNQPSVEVAFIHFKFALIDDQRQRIDSANYFYDSAWKWYLGNVSEQYEDFIGVLDAYTNYLDITQQLEKLIQVIQVALPHIEKKETLLSTNYYRFSNSYAESLYLQLQISKALQQMLLNMDIAKKLYGNLSLTYAKSIEVYGNALREAGRLNEAINWLEQSVQIKKQIKDLDQTEWIQTYLMLGNLYADQANFQLADQYYNQTYQLAKKLAPDNHSLLVAILKSMGYSHIDAGRMLEARLEIQQALQMAKASNLIEEGELLLSLANIDLQLQQYASCTKHVSECQLFLKKNKQDKGFYAAKLKEVTGLLEHRKGFSKLGLEQLKEAVVLMNQLFGSSSQHQASVLSNIGIILQETADYAGAEKVLRESLDIRINIFGKQHPQVAISLLNLGNIYMQQGRFREADDVYLRALRMYQEFRMVQHPNYVLLLNNIGLLGMKMDDYSSALQIFSTLLTALEKDPLSSAQVKATFYNNLSSLYQSLFKYDSAAYYAKKAMGSIERELGKENILYIKSASNYIQAIQHQHAKEASLEYKQLEAIIDKSLDPYHEMRSIFFGNMALFYIEQKEWSKASQAAILANEVSLQFYKKNFYILSEQEKLTWWKKSQVQFSILPSIYLRVIGTPLADTLAMYMMREQMQIKGFVLQDGIQSIQRFRKSATPQMQNMLDQWQYQQQLLSKQRLLSVSERNLSVDSLENLVNQLERNMKLSEFTGISSNQEIDWLKDLQLVLKTDEVAIEFVRFDDITQSDYPVHYAALVLSGGKAVPQFVHLGTEKKLQQWLQQKVGATKESSVSRLYRSSITKKAPDIFLGDSLYAFVWKPLLPYLQNAKKVHYTADGLLHQIAFQALPQGKDKLLIDEYQLFSYASMRQLIQKSSNAFTWKSAVLIGNPNFGSIPSTAKDGWSPLPGTALEINSLHPIMTANKMQVKTMLDESATETAFQQLDGQSPDIIHVATHGFFLPDPSDRKKANASNLSRFSLVSDPLLRSGLVFAGGNSTWTGQQPAGGNDGILTAYELAQLNLSKTKMMVMSACETALGDVLDSEGVFGLQRACKLAGVQYLLLSLWQVPDQETALLMQTFYTNLLKGLSPREALYQAQKKWRNEWPPYAWAAFLIIE